MKIRNVTIQKDKVWSVEVDGNIIKLENGWTEKLFVNDKLQDVHGGISFHFRLTGSLSDGKSVKAVAISGITKVHCYIFVDNELVLKD